LIKPVLTIQLLIYLKFSKRINNHRKAKPIMGFQGFLRKILFVCLIILLSTWTQAQSQRSSINGTTAIIPREERLVNTYFNTLAAKQPPLYLCDQHHAFFYRLPKRLKCGLLKLTKPSTIVGITIWYTDVSIAKVTAYHCYATSQYIRKSYFFFGSYSETTTETTLPVSADECSLMVKRMLSPKNHPMLRIRDDAFGTQLTSKVQYQWPHTRDDIVENWYFTVISVSANNADEELIAPVPLLAPCHIYENRCKTSDNGVLIYDGAQFQVCRLQRGASSKCLFSDDSRISCPELSIAINQLTTSPICGANIGTSGQGILWTQDLLNEVNGVVATTDQVDLLTRGERSFRKKRETKTQSEFGDDYVRPLYVKPTTTTPRYTTEADDPNFVFDKEEVVPFRHTQRIRPTQKSIPTMSTSTTEKTIIPTSPTTTSTTTTTTETPQTSEKTLAMSLTSTTTTTTTQPISTTTSEKPLLISQSEIVTPPTKFVEHTTPDDSHVMDFLRHGQDPEERNLILSNDNKLKETQQNVETFYVDDAESKRRQQQWERMEEAKHWERMKEAERSDNANLFKQDPVLHENHNQLLQRVNTRTTETPPEGYYEIPIKELDSNKMQRMRMGLIQSNVPSNSFSLATAELDQLESDVSERHLQERQRAREAEIRRQMLEISEAQQRRHEQGQILLLEIREREKLLAEREKQNSIEFEKQRQALEEQERKVRERERLEQELIKMQNREFLAHQQQTGGQNQNTRIERLSDSRRPGNILPYTSSTTTENLSWQSSTTEKPSALSQEEYLKQLAANPAWMPTAMPTQKSGMLLASLAETPDLPPRFENANQHHSTTESSVYSPPTQPKTIVRTVTPKPNSGMITPVFREKQQQRQKSAAFTGLRPPGIIEDGDSTAVSSTRRPATDYESSIFTAADVNARLQFLVDAVKDNISYALQLIHTTTCQTQQTMLDLLRSLAETSPSVIVHTLLADSRYEAELVGDALAVARCNEITEYQFIMPNDTVCTAEFPVRYIYKHEQYVGYLRGLSKEIVSEPTIIPCPMPPFYFDTGDEIILLNNKSMISNIPYLPLPIENDHNYEMADIAFTSQGHLKTKKLDGTANLMALMKLASNPNRIDHILKAHQSGIPLTPQQYGVSDSLRDLMLRPFEDLAYTGLSILALVILGLIVLTLVISYRAKIAGGMIYALSKLRPAPRQPIRLPDMRYIELQQMNRQREREEEEAFFQQPINVVQIQPQDEHVALMLEPSAPESDEEVPETEEETSNPSKTPKSNKKGKPTLQVKLNRISLNKLKKSKVDQNKDSQKQTQSTTPKASTSTSFAMNSPFGFTFQPAQSSQSAYLKPSQIPQVSPFKLPQTQTFELKEQTVSTNLYPNLSTNWNPNLVAPPPSPVTSGFSPIRATRTVSATNITDIPPPVYPGTSESTYFMQGDQRQLDALNIDRQANLGQPTPKAAAWVSPFTGRPGN